MIRLHDVRIDNKAVDITIVDGLIHSVEEADDGGGGCAAGVVSGVAAASTPPPSSAPASPPSPDCTTCTRMRP